MNTPLVIFAIVAALGLVTATATLVVIPNIPQAQASGNPGYGRCNNPGLDHSNEHCIGL
jgi:hypothetical protein